MNPKNKKGFDCDQPKPLYLRKLNIKDQKSVF